MPSPNLGATGSATRGQLTAASLSNVADLSYPDGASVYVVNPSGSLSGQYWFLDKKSTQAPDGVNVIATKSSIDNGSGIGRWVVASSFIGTAGSLFVPSRSALSLLPDTSLTDGTPVFNSESGYQADWVLRKTGPESTLTVDNLTVVATASGVGRFVLKSRLAGRVPVTECGAKGDGVTDDTAAFQSLANALAGTGAELWVPQPSVYYLIAGNVDPPSNTVIRLSPIATALFKTTNATSFTGMLNPRFPEGGISGCALHANATFGQTTFQLDSVSAPGPSVGQYVYIAQGNTTQWMPITGVTSLGGNSYTIKSSEGIVFPFTTGATVDILTTIATDVTLHAEGALVSGPGVRAWEAFGEARNRVVGLRVDASLGNLSDACMSMDGGGYDSEFHGCWTNGGIGGLGFETHVRGLAEACTCQNPTGSGSINAAFFCLDSYASGFASCHALNAHVGYRFGSNSNGLGNNACYARDCDAVDCNTALIVEAFSDATVIDGFFIGNYGAGGGVVTASSSGTTTVIGLRVQSGPSTSTWMVNASGSDIHILGWDGSGPYGGAFLGPTTFLRDVELSSIAATGLYFDGTTAELSGGNITVGIGATAIDVAGGVLSLDNVTVTQTAAATALAVASGAVANIGPGCSFDGATTPINVSAGGTVTMAQTGGVASISGAAGAKKLTFAQHYSTSIEIGNGTSISSGTCTVNVLANFIGQEFTVKNYNTTGSTTTFAGVSIPASTTYRIRCNAAGTWEHVSLS